MLCKQGGPYQEGELRQLLREELQDLCEEGQEIRNERFYFQGMKVEEAFGSVCVGLGFSHKKEMHPFLGKQTEYEQAKVVIAPVAYASSTFIPRQ